MISIKVRNVHEALPIALDILDVNGIERSSRNGPVKMVSQPVITEYVHPEERVIFWQERNANPFFHLYEALWMLDGREDVYGLRRFIKTIMNYSDNGEIFHGAYGWRWRNHFKEDQLEVIARNLIENPDDRRNILQAWDPWLDLGSDSKDVPCNVCATFQINNYCLDMTVFCRSNDIIWGCYGANAVHFSMLQEYLATWIGCPIGRYHQISVNWHAYTKVLDRLKRPFQPYEKNPYDSVHRITMSEVGDINRINEAIQGLLLEADSGFVHKANYHDPWSSMVRSVFLAHHEYSKGELDFALEILYEADQKADWIKAATEWIERKNGRKDLLK